MMSSLPTVQNSRATGVKKKYVLVVVVVVNVMLIRLGWFFYGKCDTRRPMADLLTKASRLFQEHQIEYWLDKGTLLGIHRDDGLIPWEYDVDFGVRNSTCAQISLLKPQLKQLGLLAYDRADHIPHKVKLTYDTENHRFYYSDPFLHDPCLRIYDQHDLSTWIDIYWYVQLNKQQIDSKRAQGSILIPQGYDDHQGDLLCCSEGLKEFSPQMCCGGCVPIDTVFPLQKQKVRIVEGQNQIEPLPNKVAEFLTIQYGPNSLKDRQVKGWKGVVCGFWVNPVLFFVEVVVLIGLIAAGVVYGKRYLTRKKQMTKYAL